MKKAILTFALGILTTTVSIAQDNKAQNIDATYVMEVKMDYDQTMKTIPEAYRAQFGPMLKAEIDGGIFMTYFFKSNSKNSTFTLEEKVNNGQGGLGIIAQQMAAMDNKPTYKDFTVTPHLYYKEVDMGVKQYLIKDQIPDYKWKISREKTDIAGYQATKAEGVMMDSIPVTAWYAPAIPIKDGPTSLAGLPGLIIKAEFEANGAKMIYTLKDLKISDKDLKIALPTKGEVVTQDEFMKVVLEIQKKAQELMDGGVDTK
ncbi:GLPGLI family protein [Empedobacter stercoris]|uniref:GLPGLI family protein n=1 Tax=Empedobacter stercoris TaxID=1628248 RepID=A0ABX1WPZ9_9FLAO|nr:GLPGLI family protein [Empedobacter stercoris]NOJ76573.1 GLPGLI family protein [Empedobacter stercoris]